MAGKMSKVETNGNRDDDKELEFFLYDEPVDVLASLRRLKSQLESNRICNLVHDDNDELFVEERHTFPLPKELSYAKTRVINLLKRYGADPEIVDDCSYVMSSLCGEGPRSSNAVVVSFVKESLELEIVLPDFSDGDVGYRLWGACFLLSKFLFSISAELKQAPTVIELGAASGLCGIVASKLGCRAVCLTDFNEACLRAARESVATNQLEETVSVEYLDWSKPFDEIEYHTIQWENAIILGAAVVYEPLHATLICQVLNEAFRKQSKCAYIAIHKEHTGHETFMKMSDEQFCVEILDERQLRESTVSPTTVVLMKIQSK